MRQASHVFPTGVKPVYKLQTTEGYTVRLTYDHKVLTNSRLERSWSAYARRQDCSSQWQGRFWYRQGMLIMGVVLGWLVGDGSINTKQDASITLSFFGNKQAIAPQFAEAVNRLVATPVGQRQYQVGVQTIVERDESRIESVRLTRLVDPELMEGETPGPFFGSEWFI